MESHTDKHYQLREEPPREQNQQFWSEHRTTLISFQTQYVHNLRPQSSMEPEDVKRPKGKKKNIQYQGGFLFPGRPGDKEQSIPQLIQSSKYNNLKDLFEERPNTARQQGRLKEFVKIMLELKHNTILKQFLEIYDLIIREIKDVKFDVLRGQRERFAIVEQIAAKVTKFVLDCTYLFQYFSRFMKENRRETMQLLKVTAYCFLGEKYIFNINQFYSEAFDVMDHETKVTKKRKKIEEQHE